MSFTLDLTESVASAYPKGEYLASMRKCELKPTSNNQGTILCMWFDMHDPEFKGQTMYLQENYTNNNETAQEIGRRRVGSIAVACGIKLGVGIDPNKMLNKKIILSVDISQQEGYDDRNHLMSARPGNAVKTTAPTKPGVKPAAKPAPKETPKHVANEETSQEMPEDDIQESEIVEEAQNEEDHSQKSKPAYMNPGAKKPAPKAPPKPKAKPKVAEVLEYDCETLGEPEEDSEGYYVAVDSSTGANYRYEEDGKYHLIES